MKFCTIAAHLDGEHGPLRTAIDVYEERAGHRPDTDALIRNGIAFVKATKKA